MKETMQAVLDELDTLLMDEDLTSEKLRYASASLLPRAADVMRRVLEERAR